MEFKYPKKIRIGETIFKIKYDKKDDGASFNYPENGKDAYIRFGLQHHELQPWTFLGLLIHELKEIIQVEQSTRLWHRGRDGFIFVYSHAEHTDLCCRLAGLLQEFIK